MLAAYSSHLLYAARSVLYKCAASGFAGEDVFGSVKRLWIDVSRVETWAWQDVHIETCCRYHLTTGLGRAYFIAFYALEKG